MPPPRSDQNAAAWTIGAPDLIVSSPVLDIKPVAADFMTDIGPSPTHLTEDRYIQAVEVREVARANGGLVRPPSVRPASTSSA